VTPELARRALSAFLQVPPHAAFLPASERERRAAALLEAFTGSEAIPDDARRAHRLALGANRPDLPEAAQAVTFATAPVLTHPLSHHDPLTLELPDRAADGTSLDRHVLDAARRLAEPFGGDPVPTYLAAWRWLPDALRAAETEKVPLGALWDVLPADPSTPDHTLADQMSATAALAVAGAQPAFLVFAVGPVQGFIAQARSTRDLWVGSYLVAWLSWHAIRAMADAFGPSALLYPSLRGQPLVDAWLGQRGAPAPANARPAPEPVRRVAAFPNKLLALVPAVEAGAVANTAVEAVRAAWRGLGRGVREYLTTRTGIGPDADVWERQLDQQLETTWVSLPWAAGGEEESWVGHVRALLGPGALSDVERTLAAYAGAGPFAPNPGSYYAPAHGLAQRAFDARKLTRTFEPAAEPGFKCTLCGLRAPMLGSNASYRDQRSVWRQQAAALGRPELLDPSGNERLCAVCLTKRVVPEIGLIKEALGAGAPAFPSTSTLATLPFRRALLAGLGASTPLAEAATALVDSLDELRKHSNSLNATVRIDRSTLGSFERYLQTVPAALKPLAIRLLSFDGEWLLPETYERRRTQARADQAPPALLEALDVAQRSLAYLLAVAHGAGLRRPSSYYAILLLDGDHMGRWVSGEQHQATLADVLHPHACAVVQADPAWAAALGERRLFTPATHTALAAILRDFALWVVPETVEVGHEGRVVYAGGDDVLAVLPADRALGALADLRRRYQSAFLGRDGGGAIVEALLRVPRPDLAVFRGMGPDATASAGLLFAHHLLPLGLALEEARRLEKRAKGEGGRDAVAIGVARRSGLDPELVLVSKHDRGAVTIQALLADVRQVLGGAADDAAGGAAQLPYRLRELAVTLAGLGNADACRSAVAALAKRHVRDEDGRRRLLAVYDALARAPQPARSPDADGLSAAPPVEQLVSVLRLARFLEAEA